jgi:hypothetical protein
MKDGGQFVCNADEYSFSDGFIHFETLGEDGYGTTFLSVNADAVKMIGLTEGETTVEQLKTV